MKLNLTVIIAVLALATVLFSSCSDDPTASFSASSTTVNVGETVKFQDASDAAAKYYWDFGDGNRATFNNAVNPTHVYEDEGVYTVSLKVINEKGDASATDSTTIEVVGKNPSADFSSSSSFIEVGEKVTLENNSSNAYAYYWDFGDGSHLTTEKSGTNPTHVYDKAGNYEIKLTVTNEEGDKKDSQTKSIQVGDAAMVMKAIWDLDRYENTEYINGQQDSQTEINYQSTTIDFFSETEYIRNDENGNESANNWRVLKDDRVRFDNRLFVIDTLTESQMTFRRVEKSTDFQGNNIKEVWIYEFSR